MTSVSPLKVRVGLGANARKKEIAAKQSVAIRKLPCHFLHLSDAPLLFANWVESGLRIDDV